MPEYDKTIFANNLRQLMDANDVNASDIAKLLNVSRSTVSEWLHGRKLPRMDKVETLSIHFHVTKSSLIEPTDDNIDCEDTELVNGDPELTAYLDQLRTRPEMRMLFSLTKDATKADVERAVAIIEALRGAGNVDT